MQEFNIETAKANTHYQSFKSSPKRVIDLTKEHLQDHPELFEVVPSKERLLQLRKMKEAGLPPPPLPLTSS